MIGILRRLSEDEQSQECEEPVEMSIRISEVTCIPLLVLPTAAAFFS